MEFVEELLCVSANSDSILTVLQCLQITKICTKPRQSSKSSSTPYLLVACNLFLA
jgi:hypothetical protein